MNATIENKQSALTIAKNKRRAEELRDRYSTGKLADTLPPIVPGIVNSSAMIEAHYLDFLDSIGQTTATEKSQLREARLQSLKDQIRQLGTKLAEVAEQSELNADAFAEALAYGLANSGRLKSHIEECKEFRREYERDWILMHGILESLFGSEKYEAVVEAVRGEIANV